MVAEDGANDGTSNQNYTVLARRYRPQQFEECIGQDHVWQSLQNAIRSGRVAHAYLFTGARGVGKTSTARILAKALNCEKGPTDTPCGTCDICRSIAAGEDVDVIEIDGASNRGIDEVRELRQGVGYRPTRSRYKVYIIDEVHMLTKEAFNALLKTLEEPPPHVKFLFATTEPQKIPITILSRCQRFDFAGIEVGKILDRLKEIVAAENMAVDEEALEVIARRAGGSMRDSQSLLDQLLALGGDRLTADDVHRILGTASVDRVVELAAAVFRRDAAGCLTAVDAAVSAGAQLGEWVEQFVEYLRDLMVLKFCPEAALASVPNRFRATLAGQANDLAPERLMEMMDLLVACRARMKASAFARTLIEMTFVRLCRLDEFINLQALPPAAAGARPATSSSPPVVRAGATSSAPGRPIPSAPKSDAPSKKNSLETNLAPSSIAGPGDGETNAPPRAVVELTAESASSFWKQAKEVVSDIVVRSMLGQSARATFLAPSTLKIWFPGQLENTKRYLEDPGRLGKIEQACCELAGRRIAVALEIEAAAGPAATTPAAEWGAVRDEAARHPLVRRAEEVLGAKMIEAPTRVRGAAKPATVEVESDE